MNPLENSDEADALRIHRQLLGDLNPEEFHKLESDLMASQSLRERFMRAIRLDMSLRDQDFEALPAPALPKVESRWLNFSSTVAAIAALLFLAAMVVWRTTPPAKISPTSTGMTHPGVATLVDVRDCKWAGDQTLPLESRFTEGSIELTTGVAVIQFDGGAKLALQGPARLEVIGPKTARLHRGNATVRCEQGSYTFSLLTPTSSVVDLGTEFGVAVDSQGTSEVHVLDGAVEVVNTVTQFEPSIRLLNVGETLALASNGTGKIITETTQKWIRDYRTPLDRKTAALPPRLLARDPFPSSLSQPNRFALGTGWNGGWWLASENTGDYHFVEDAPLTKRDGSKGLAMSVGWGEARRKLAEPIDPTVSQIIYLGLSMNRESSLSPDGNGRLSEATFMLRSSKDPTSLLALGLSTLNHWVVMEQGERERSDLPETGSGPFFMIAKIEFNPLGGNRVSIKAYNPTEEIPNREPESWDLITQRKHSQMTAPLDTIALRVRQSPFKFGEISIGNSWQAVVNPSSAAQ